VDLLVALDSDPAVLRFPTEASASLTELGVQHVYATTMALTSSAPGV
jgi:hypothetical protein